MEPAIIEELEEIEGKGLRRKMRFVRMLDGQSALVDGQEAVVFCSNDYLGLSRHPLVIEAAIEAARRYGAGSGASRLVSGNLEPHRSLEERIRAFKKTEAALVFNSGYQANLALCALAERGSEVFSDRLNHASIVDACILSRAKFSRYPHRDTGALEGMLKTSKAKRRLIVTDGVFSMDGSIAPLPELARLAEMHGALLYVDDAHSTGVLGASGRGTLEHFRMETSPFIIQMGTLGKALGTFGAFIAGSQNIIDLLVSKARPFIFSTALPPSVCASAQKAIEIAATDNSLRERLWANIDALNHGLKSAGLIGSPSPAPIIPIIAGDADRTMRLSERLLEMGIFIQGIRPPTVPVGSSRLRMTVTAAHTVEEIQRAVSALKEAFSG